VFSTDWTFATEEWLPDRRFTGKSTEPAKIPVTVVNSGPDEPDRSFLKTFIFICNHAKERLDIFTPYFGPEDSVILAMQLAARRGVRVRMLIPTPNEHQYMVDIGRAHYEQLMEDGVEIYEYHEAVHHGKVYIVDDNLFVLGSTNLDARSLRINFETTLLVEHPDTVTQLDELYSPFFERAERIELEKFRNQPLTDKLKQGISRLFVPIL
ncbi:MAG: phospholipase D-like domain-containing protein, partial [Puniceicoccales bacterium]